MANRVVRTCLIGKNFDRIVAWGGFDFLSGSALVAFYSGTGSIGQTLDFVSNAPHNYRLIERAHLVEVDGKLDKWVDGDDDAAVILLFTYSGKTFKAIGEAGGIR